MLLFVFKYDFLLVKANRLMQILALMTALLFVLAFYDGYSRMAFQRQVLKEIQAQEAADYKKYGEQIATAKPVQHYDGGHFGDPTVPFYFGNRMGAKYAVLPPAALSIISAGQSDVYPYYYKVTLSKKQALYYSEELENPRILYNGRFDVSFVIIFLLPLLIIAFTYNIYSAEKEGGTLQLLMAQNFSFHQITAYRFLFRYLLFNSFVTICFLVGLTIFSPDSFHYLGDVSTVILISWLYAAFWFSVSYFVNCLKRSSGVSASILTGIWLTLVLIVPTLISSLIDWAHPIPSKLELITKTRNVSDSIAQNKNIVNRFLEEHPEFKPVNADPKDQNSMRLRSRIEIETAMEKVKAAHTMVAAQREAAVSRYRFLSPAIFLQQLLNKVAGTDDDRYKDFDKTVIAYQQKFRNFFEPLVYRQEKLTTVHLQNIPNYTPPQHINISAGGNKVFTDVLYLVLCVLLVLWLAFLRLKRAKG
jgi:ABC-2 type transport system permease protein